METSNNQPRLRECLNIPKLICKHLMGEEHSNMHHMAVGFILMVIGVCIAKNSVEFHSVFVHFGGDILGYGIHLSLIHI